MTINQILKYCLESPANTNKAILHQMLKELATEGETLATINGVKCKTLNEAIELASNNDVIELKDNIVDESLEINKNLTLNLNGNTISNDKVALTITNNATLTINDGKIVGRVIVGRANNDGNIIINNSTLQCFQPAEAAIQTNGLCKNSSITLNNVILDSYDDTLYLPGDGKYLIENCVINGYTGIYAKSGTITIKNTKINAYGSFAEPVPNGNGANSTGDAIILDSKQGYNGDIGLILEGKNEFTSKNGYAIHEAITDLGLSATVLLTIEDGAYIGQKGALKTSQLFDDSIESGKAICKISGGIYSSEIDEKYLADNVSCIKYTGGKYIVK